MTGWWVLNKQRGDEVTAWMSQQVDAMCAGSEAHNTSREPRVSPQRGRVSPQPVAAPVTAAAPMRRAPPRGECVPPETTFVWLGWAAGK